MHWQIDELTNQLLSKLILRIAHGPLDWTWIGFSPSSKQVIGIDGGYLEEIIEDHLVELL